MLGAQRMIKAIVFDKDGTLLDFERLWVPVAQGAVKTLLEQAGADLSLTEPVLHAFGAYDGILGMLCYGTYRGITEKINEAAGTAFAEEIVERAFVEALPLGVTVPTCPDLQGVLTALKDRGLKLAMVTSDNAEGAAACLEALGVSGVLDKVYVVEGDCPPKPDPYYMRRFCTDFDLMPDEVMMVGDTLTDMEFAHRGGVAAVGVAKTAACRELLQPRADVIIPDVSYLPALLDTAYAK